MKLRTEVIEKIRMNVEVLLLQYKEGLQAAIAEEGMVSISLPVKMVQKGNDLDVAVGISFVKSRIKDDVAFTVSDQIEMFKLDGVSIEKVELTGIVDNRPELPLIAGV